MKFNRLILSIIPALALASCTEFDDLADRLTEIPADQVKPVRNVLLMDFTGQICSNCPTAHEHIESYEEMFGSRLIAVSIHGGSMSISSGPFALANQEGEEYNSKFEIDSWPSAVVDWNSGNLKNNYGKWLTEIISGMITPTDLDLSASAKVTPDSLISVEVKMRSDQAQDPSSHLQIWLTEDSIVKIQTMPDGSRDMNYVHNNVFRTSVCGINGEQVSIPANAEQVVTHSTPIDEAWVPENMHAVVFVYTESKGVTTVVKTPVNITE